MSKEELKNYPQQQQNSLPEEDKPYEHSSPHNQNASDTSEQVHIRDPTESSAPPNNNTTSNESKTMSNSASVTQSSNTYTPSSQQQSLQQQQQLVFPPSDVKHFVGGFNIDVTEENLRAYFSKFGTVAEVKIMRDPVSGHSKGFGFVTMAEPSSKSRIFDEKEHIICGKKASVRPYTESDAKDTFTDGPILKRKIFVGGVNPALGHDILENYFSKYGPLEDATIMRYPDGRSRGFGFVVFRDEAACQQVLQQRNHCVTPRDKVEVKPCLSRGKSRPMCGGPMATEPYYRYSGAGGPGGMGGHFQPYSSSSSGGYGYSGGGYYNPTSMYGHYGRSYDVYAGGHGSGWGGGDYRDWWSPYESYGNYYSGGWQGGGGGYGVSASHQGPYGPASKATALDSAPPPRASSSDVGYYDMGHGPTGTSSAGSRSYSHMMSGGSVMPVLPPGGTGASSIGPSDMGGPHVYNHMRRGPGSMHANTPSYSMARNRSGGY